MGKAPPYTAVASERAGLTDVLLMGIVTMWIMVGFSPIAEEQNLQRQSCGWFQVRPIPTVQ